MVQVKKPRVAVFVEGGLIQSIMSTDDIDVLVVDFDCEGSDGYQEYVDQDGDKVEANAYIENPEVEPQEVERWFKQVAETSE